MRRKKIKNKTGVVKLGEDKLFYKILKKEYFDKEINGYIQLSKYYPVPRLVYTSPSPVKEGVIIFEYEKTIGKNRGLLVDKFSYGKTLDKDFKIILDLYRTVFLKTLKKGKGAASDIFFKDRVKTRLTKYYKQSFIKRNLDFSFNGNRVSGNVSIIFKSIESFFQTQNKQWCILSQCDPNDLNIGIKPVIFDYTAGGSVPLMAEFATFFWYQLAQGSYLSLKYNSKAFNDHDNIYKRIDYVELRRKKLVHIPSYLRVDYIREYIKNVIKPCFKKIPIEERSDWYEQFKNYLALKILGVFNVSKMDKKDQLLSIGYLHLFYNSQITNLENLLELINVKKIYEGSCLEDFDIISRKAHEI